MPAQRVRAQWPGGSHWCALAVGRQEALLAGRREARLATGNERTTVVWCLGNDRVPLQLEHRELRHALEDVKDLGIVNLIVLPGERGDRSQAFGHSGRVRRMAEHTCRSSTVIDGHMMRWRKSSADCSLLLAIWSVESCGRLLRFSRDCEDEAGHQSVCARTPSAGRSPHKFRGALTWIILLESCSVASFWH